MVGKDTFGKGWLEAASISDILYYLVTKKKVEQFFKVMSVATIIRSEPVNCLNITEGVFGFGC